MARQNEREVIEIPRKSSWARRRIGSGAGGSSLLGGRILDMSLVHRQLHFFPLFPLLARFEMPCSSRCDRTTHSTPPHRPPTLRKVGTVCCAKDTPNTSGAEPELASPGPVWVRHHLGFCRDLPTRLCHAMTTWSTAVTMPPEGKRGIGRQRRQDAVYWKKTY